MKNRDGKPYVEPTGFIPEDIRKKYKLGEYNDDVYGDEAEKADDDDNEAFRNLVNGRR